MELRSPRESGRAGIRTLLADNDLPFEDLHTTAIDFIVAVDDERIVGVVGLETFAGVGLLRSLAVDAASRGSGAGTALVQAAETREREHGLSQLVLLTQTAAEFFARRGCRILARHAAPVAVQASGEFRSICPTSATCMTRLLDS